MNPREEIHFDGWTLHTTTGELARGATHIRLQVQPQQVLEALLERPGEMVTRDQLIARLWPRGIVNFDLSLNNAVHRLRVALGDRAETPRYIETIPRRGYRFVGSVGALPVVAPASAPAAATSERPAMSAIPRPRWRLAAAALLLIFISVSAGSLSQVDSRHSWPGPTAVRADGAAHERVVRAEYFLHRRMPGDLERARRNLVDALAIDPGFARAWAGLASAYWLETVEGGLPPDQGLPEVREAAERALALDPHLAEAHLRLASYWWRAGDSRKARESMAVATTLEPDNALALSMSAGAAAWNGQLDRAIELQRRAVESGPLSLVNRGNLIAYLLMADRLDEAKAEVLRMQELHAEAPDFASLYARTLVLEGRFNEALDLAETMPDTAERRFSEAIAHFRLGNRAVADAAMLALIDMSREQAPMLLIAEAHAYRGESDKAFAWLQSLPNESCEDPSVQHSPFLRPLRTDPRWNAWLKSAGLRAVIADGSEASQLRGPVEGRARLRRDSAS
jgi:DNA-binding winged helix-turn-helix (wHTH) protein/Tfp pilus assembly protein PilF